MSDLILILDDERPYAELLAELLADNGFQSEICTHSREAIERLRERSFALIVTDYKMPDLDGAEFLIEIRRSMIDVPVVMISGLMGKQDLIRVANIGVNLVLEKPFNVPVFLDYVRGFVAPGSDRAEPKEAAADTPAGGGEALPELRHAVARGPGSRQFMRDLRGALPESRHLLLELPNGSELSLIARECAEWLGAPGLANFHFSASEILEPGTREAIASLETSTHLSPLVVVSHLGEKTLDLEALKEFVRWTSGRGDRVRFLHAFPRGHTRSEDLTTDALGPTVSALLALPPLRERLPDLASLAGGILAEFPADPPRCLSTEAVDALLNHDWPENYRELKSVLRRAAGVSREAEISLAAMRIAMEERHRDLGERRTLGLEGFLLAEQRRFLRERLEGDDATVSLPDLLGAQSNRLVAHQAWAEQPLLFPELVIPVEGPADY